MPKGTFSAFITVYARRQGADIYDQLSSYLITAPTTIEIVGMLEDVKITITNVTGTGVLFTQLMSRENIRRREV